MVTVVADSKEIAERAIKIVKVEYEPSDSIVNVLDALKENSTIIHEEMDKYSHISSIDPEPGINIVNSYALLKKYET